MKRYSFGQKRKKIVARREVPKEGCICRWQEEGMVKTYYEDALRANLGTAESDENGRGAADIRPQPDADLEDAMDTMDESPKKRSRIEMEEVKDDDQLRLTMERNRRQLNNNKRRNKTASWMNKNRVKSMKIMIS